MKSYPAVIPSVLGEGARAIGGGVDFIPQGLFLRGGVHQIMVQTVKKTHQIPLGERLIGAEGVGIIAYIVFGQPTYYLLGPVALHVGV